MRSTIAILSLFCILAGCKNHSGSSGSEPHKVKQYSIEQFYKSIRVGGGAFSTDDQKLAYFVFPDEGHGFKKKENEIRGYGAILKFLDKYLKGSSPVTNKLN